jgi:putative transposase
MNKFTEKAVVGLSETGLGLDELVRHGARQVIQQAIEAELTALLERFENVKTMHGQRAVVRNGYLPEREVLTAAGPIAVKVPKVRDRSGSGVKFNSSIVPPYVRKSPRVSAALPWLYLKGISTGDMSEALSVLLGEDAKGLSANVVSRLKAQWADEHAGWSRRDLSKSRYVYWWVDGIHTGLRSENSDGQCLLVIIGVRPDGRKERVAIGGSLAAIDPDDLTGDVVHLVGRQKHDRLSDLFRPSNPFRRHAGNHAGLSVGIAGETRKQRGLHRPGSDRIDPYARCRTFECGTFR